MREIPAGLTSALADRYTIERQLGQGGMATVYLAEDLKHHRQVAVKVLRPELTATLGPERFLREIETTANLRHPHILPLYHSGEAAGFLFYVMPFVEGESLRDRLNREKQLPIEDALQIAREVADALGYAHGRGVIHRDIKPENILLERGQAVVADFGIARALSTAGAEKLTQTGMAVGTPMYMSPEQSVGEGDLDGRSDLYSLGCVLYEMLAGEPPYSGPTAQAIVAKRFREPVPRISTLRETVPPALDDTVARVLAKSPADRFATAIEFGGALSEIALRGPEPGRPGPRSETGAASSRRLSTRLRFIVAAGAGTLAVVAALLWAGRSADRRTGSAEVPRLAVLPFADNSSARDQEWFAAGMHEALLTALQQIGGLRVTSRGSSMRYRSSTLLVPEIARELHVRWLVEGSVVRAGNRFQVTAQLVDGPTDQQVWARQYERDVPDILALQNEVARTIAAEVRAALTPEEERRLAAAPRVDPGAYRAYVLGLQHFDRVTLADFRRSVALFNEAVSLDPTFARAHAALAFAYGIAVEYGWVSRAEAGPLAERAAGAAERLDPGSASAYHARANVRFHIRRDFASAEQNYQKAMSLESSAYTLFEYGWLLSQTGRHAKAVAALEQAVELDPRSPLMHNDLGWWLYGARQLERAIAQARFAIDLDSTFPEAYWLLAAAHAGQGRFDLGLQEFDRYESIYGGPVFWFRGYLLALAGRRQEAIRDLAELKRRVDKGASSPVELAQIYLGLGDREAVLKTLEQAPEAGVSFQPYLWPEYETYHSEPRFRAVLEKISLPLLPTKAAKEGTP